MRLIWLVLVLVLMPFAVGLTSDFGALSDGIFRRSFTEVTPDCVRHSVSEGVHEAGRQSVIQCVIERVIGSVQE